MVHQQKNKATIFRRPNISWIDLFFVKAKIRKDFEERSPNLVIFTIPEGKKIAYPKWKSI